MDATREARMAEIQKKKAKLEDLRRTRQLRGQEIHTTRQSLSDRSDIHQPSPSRLSSRQDIDHLLTSIEGQSPRGRGSRPESTASSRPLSGQRLSSGSGEPALEASTPTSAPSSTIYSSASTQTQVAPLSTVIEPTSEPAPAIPKKVEVITYEKGTQTSDEFESQRARGDGTEEWPDESEGAKEEQRAKELEQIREDLRKEVEAEVRSTLEQTNANGAETTNGQDRFPLRVLTEEEREAVITSQDFREFVDSSTKIIDRALDEQYDILFDYARGSGRLDDDEEDEGYSKGRSRRGRRVKQIAQYWDERWSNKRMISDIDFSPKQPELMLASFTKNPSAPQEPHGLVQLWSSGLRSRPERIFHNPSSDILTARFSPFHTDLIVGGCYSGQVLIWDKREASPLPVQKTPLTGLGHTHPIYSLDIVGTQNANNIISCSTDGVVCTWSMDMLAQPQEKLELRAPIKPSVIDDVAPQCIAFPASDPTYFLAGTEEGSIYACHRYERAGAKAGIDTRVLYAGHAAPVLALDFHPARGPVDLGDLVLSASMDWTIKLWRVRPPATLGAAVSGAPAEQGPTIDIPREDIVYAAAWSPVRPGVFAAVDGAGWLEVWDVKADVEVPVARVQPTAEQGTAWPKRSLNKIAWERTEGKRLAVGGLDGVVTVFEVGSELGGTEGARSDEWQAVKKVVNRAEAQLSAKSVVSNGDRK
ncbi:putative dynein intermediate chain [Microthyrium microscopicum]|uniref:Putative dynein intermediate chain n=1 Tax=Microthyrium microscopicum TaxID=703497 RepID=A0A6A6UR36_9PEZI|nr:putative dynein intermediate chain [Microthyrium microscopicum]